MICKQCKKQIPDIARICPYCGTSCTPVVKPAAQHPQSNSPLPKAAPVQRPAQENVPIPNPAPAPQPATVPDPVERPVDPRPYVAQTPQPVVNNENSYTPKNEPEVHEPPFETAQEKTFRGYDPNHDGYYDDVLPDMAEEVNKLPTENFLRVALIVVALVIIVLLLLFK